jgi:hypothetical protein
VSAKPQFPGVVGFVVVSVSKHAAGSLGFVKAESVLQVAIPPLAASRVKF